MAASDYGDHEKYIGLVREMKQTPLSLHWENLLKPMVPAYLGGGVLQYYQIENKRIPIMSFLSFDEPRALTRGDLARIGFAAKWGPSETLPFSPSFLADFEERYCYDRFWDGDDPASGMSTRYTICGPAFAMITRECEACRELVQTFRHQFFQIGMLVNFHKGALLNLSNRFSVSVERLRVGDYDSVRIFKQGVRDTLELFLRFNHRYWFHEISNQVLAADIYKRWSSQLGSERALRRGARGVARHQRVPRRRPHAPLLGQRAAPHRGLGVRHGRHGRHRLPRHEPLQPGGPGPVGEARDLPRGVRADDRAHRLDGADLAPARDLMEALASERMTWKEKTDAFRQIWFGAKRARMTRALEPAPRPMGRAPPDPNPS